MTGGVIYSGGATRCGVALMGNEPMVISVLALTFWGVSLYYRCSDKIIRRRLVTIASLFIAWLVLVMVKYESDSPSVARLCWYAFYIPLLLTPALCLSMAFRAAALDRLVAVRIVKAALFAASTVIALFILANDTHHLAFVFDATEAGWNSSYTYGPLYWLASSLIIVMFLSFAAVLAFAGRKRIRRIALLVAVFVFVGLAYHALYVLRHTFAVGSNFSLTYIVLISLALELCLDFGLLPSFIMYEKAFSGLPLDARILSRKGRTIYETARSKPAPALDALLPAYLEGGPDEAVFRDEDDPDKAFHLKRLSGGYVLLAEDVSEINRSRTRLERIHTSLIRQNEVLKRERNLKESLHQSERERELLESIDASLRDTVESIGALLDQAETMKTSESQEERRKVLTMVRMLVAYCKRKGGLVLAERDGDDFGIERLRVIMNETAGDLRSVGIECAALVETEAPLSAATMNTLYDCFYDFVIKAFFCENPVVMLFLTDRSEGSVELRALLEFDGGEDATHSEWCAELRRTLDQRNVAYRLTADEGAVKLAVIAESGRSAS
ncbi:histidine kinase N-terminal 7TM domain-containing protein [Berryella intestinalis]|nr:histidine kinase N-terminal 7TM domain-containing protein [Berryella intestinalis]